MELLNEKTTVNVGDKVWYLEFETKELCSENICFKKEINPGIILCIEDEPADLPKLITVKNVLGKEVTKVQELFFLNFEDALSAYLLVQKERISASNWYEEYKQIIKK